MHLQEYVFNIYTTWHCAIIIQVIAIISVSIRETHSIRNK